MARPAALLAVLLAAAPAVADEPVVKPDPPAAKPDWPAAVPAFELPAGGYSTLPADHAGPFAITALQAGKETTRAVFDLRTGKKVGGWKSDDPLAAGHALSPDGKLYVGVFAKGRPAAGAPLPPRALAGFETTTGKRLWEVELTGYVARVLFAGPDKVVIDHGGGGNQKDLYDAKTGKLVRTLSVRDIAPIATATSPGGAYLAVVEQIAPGAGAATVSVVGLADGTVLHRFELPAQEANRFVYAQELAFSPDGARLSAVLPVNAPGVRGLRVLSWDLATGKPDADAHIQAPAVYSHPMLRWTADGQAWFVSGLGMVDPDTGAVLWRSPNRALGFAFHVPLSAGRVVRIVGGGSGNAWRVREIALPKEKVAAALKAVRAGGLAVDGWLPAIAKADRTETREVAVPARADDWAYRPDPAPAQAAGKPLWLALAAGRVASAHVAGPVVVFELVDQTFGAPDPLAPRQLLRVDLATGKPTGRVELPHVCRLADVGPAGDVAVTADLDDARRVDVWDLTTGKHLAGWRPAGPREPGGELVHVSALSADRVLTLTQGGELAAWSVPKVQAVYTARVVGMGPPVRSPGRKYLFGLQGDTVRVIETATGKLVGDLAADPLPPPTAAPAPGTAPPVGPAGPWAVPPLAVRSDGEELTALIPRGGTDHALRWDLATAKLRDRFALGRSVRTPAAPFRYAGPDHLLLAEADLFGLKSRAVEWHYARPGATKFAADDDGRAWYVADEPTPPAAAAAGTGATAATPTAVLVAAALPHPAAVAALKAAADNTADNLLGPGKAVALKLDLTDPPGDKVKQSVRATLREALEARKLEATDGKADVVLTVYAKPVGNGPKTTVRKLLPGESGSGTAEQVELVFVATRAELTADGKAVWEGGDVQLAPPLAPQPFRLPDKETDLKAWLAERAWYRLPEVWHQPTLPRTLIRTPDGLVTLPGASELTPAGPRPTTLRAPPGTVRP
jgi:hypothetical protein